MSRVIPLIFRCFFVLCLIFPGLARTEEIPPGCPVGSCGIAESGIKPYNEIIIGHPIRVLSDTEMRALYRWAKKRAWKDFPDDENDYLDRNHAMLMPTGIKDGYVLVHIARIDYDPDFYVPEALVRYTPRQMPESYYPDGRPIHSSLAGCVSVLCTAEDIECRKGYPIGMFRFKDGVELDPETKQPLAKGRTVDPVSLRERGQALREQRKHDIENRYKK